MTKKDKHLTFLEHLEELRERIVKSVIFIVIASLIFYNYIGQVLPHLIKPIGRVVFTSPAEAFATNMMLSLFGGLFLAMPIVLYQTWQFVSVGLTQPERKYIVILFPLSLVFFILGCLFGYFAMLPMMLNFFLSFATSSMVPMITVSKYISFVGTLVLSCGLIFELPLVIAFLTKIGIATPAFLTEKRKHAIIAIFVVSAVLTPSPDCVSQILMAVPLMVLYEVSILFSKLIYRMNARKASVDLHQSSVS